MGYLTGRAPFAYWKPQGTLLWPAFETDFCFLFAMLNPPQDVESGIESRDSIATLVCLKMLCTPKPNGFADHYPY